jgi:hypothetical protein
MAEEKKASTSTLSSMLNGTEGAKPSVTAAYADGESTDPEKGYRYVQDNGNLVMNGEYLRSSC